MQSNSPLKLHRFLRAQFPDVPKTSPGVCGDTMPPQGGGKGPKSHPASRVPRGGPCPGEWRAPAALTEEPAQNGHEFFTCGEPLSDSAPKLSATMQHPRISCSSPSDSSGRAGSSGDPGAAAAAAAVTARREASAGGATSTPEAAAAAAQRGRAPGGCTPARCQRGRSGGSGGSWAAAAAAPGAPACEAPDSPATGQQEPGRTTGRDMERPGAGTRGAAGAAGAAGEGRKRARPNHLLPPPPPLPPPEPGSLPPLPPAPAGPPAPRTRSPWHPLARARRRAPGAVLPGPSPARVLSLGPRATVP